MYSLENVIVNSVLVIVCILFGWYGYRLGEEKGFNPRWSALAGFCFGLIGIAVIALRKAKK